MASPVIGCLCRAQEHKIIRRRQQLHRGRGTVGLVAIRDSTIGEYARDVRPGIWRRYLVLWLDALRPSRDSYTPLPVPELSPDEMATVMRNSPFGRNGTSSKQPAIKPRPKPPTAREN